MELGWQSVESTLNSTQRCWRLGRMSIGFQGDGCGSAQALIFVRRRLRWLVVLVAATCVCTLIFCLWKPVAPLPRDGAVAQPIDWGPSQAKPVSP